MWKISPRRHPDESAQIINTFWQLAIPFRYIGIKSFIRSCARVDHGSVILADDGCNLGFEFAILGRRVPNQDQVLSILFLGMEDYRSDCEYWDVLHWGHIHSMYK